MSEQIQPVKTATDYVSLLEGKVQDREALYRQAIIALDPKELATFMVEAGKAGVVNLGYSGDAFYTTLLKCHRRGSDGVVTDAKLTEVCRILSESKQNAEAITNIVDMMRNRRERVEVGTIVSERQDETRTEALRVLLQPQEQVSTKEFEKNLRWIYEERENRAAELGYDLHRRTDTRRPESIRILDTFLNMTPDQLQHIDEIANANGGNIARIARSIKSLNDLHTLTGFLQSSAKSKKDDAWKKGKAYIEALCL